MARIPIACTLEVEAVPDRLDEWRRLVERDVDTVERPTASSARLRLRSDDGLLRAVDLARRERSCCGFLRFSVEIDDTAWLVVHAPAEAGAVLDALVGA